MFVLIDPFGESVGITAAMDQHECERVRVMVGKDSYLDITQLSDRKFQLEVPSPLVIYKLYGDARVSAEVIELMPS